MKPAPQCPLHCSGITLPIWTGPNATAYLCQCGLRFIDPLPTQTELHAFYDQYSDPRAATEVLAANASKNAASLKRHGLTPDSRLLDFGCGPENAFAQLSPENWLGFDPYRIPKPPRWTDPEPHTLDWITLWGVLEHLPNPITEFLALRKLLRPGGHIALTTVSAESKIPFQFKPPEHLTYWTENSLRTLAHQTEFSLLECGPYWMWQKCAVYFHNVLNAAQVPAHLRLDLEVKNPDRLELVPTNEVFAVLQCP